MSTVDAQFRLRLPAELHAKLVENAEKNHRSINAEVVQRIVSSFEWDTYSPNQMTHEIDELKKQVTDLSLKLHSVLVPIEHERFKIAEKMRLKAEEKEAENLAAKKKPTSQRPAKKNDGMPFD
jgi:predicted HAD superfamily phosphohydrolase